GEGGMALMGFAFQRGPLRDRRALAALSGEDDEPSPVFGLSARHFGPQSALGRSHFRVGMQMAQSQQRARQNARSGNAIAHALRNMHRLTGPLSPLSLPNAANIVAKVAVVQTAQTEKAKKRQPPARRLEQLDPGRAKGNRHLSPRL